MRKYGPVPHLLALLLLLLGESHSWGAAIRDLAVLSQDPRAYVDRATAEAPLLPASLQDRLNAEDDALHFEPWRQEVPRHRLDQALWGFRNYDGKPGYGRSGRSHPPDWIRRIEANADFAAYPRGGFPAITLRRVDIRRLPTLEPHTLSPQHPGKDYPFDNFQESTVPAGSPIRVIHQSRDRRWLLVETAYILGWSQPDAIAPVSPEFVQRWQNGRYVTVVRDKAPVMDGRQALFRASLGSVFPRLGEDERQVWIWTAGRGKDGRALLRRAALSKAAAADKPVAFTPANAGRLAGELAGEPYGWGGLLGRRDCSALTRDLFAPFGIWLPRNSGDQAGTGRFISLKNLLPAEKENRIIREGIPWRTLLWTPGHIMVYIGLHQGNPLIFHNFWSIKTRDSQGKQARIVVGRAAVTGLHPGRGRPDIDLPEADTLQGIEGMTILGEGPANGPRTAEETP